MNRLRRPVVPEDLPTRPYRPSLFTMQACDEARRAWDRYWSRFWLDVAGAKSSKVIANAPLN